MIRNVYAVRDRLTRFLNLTVQDNDQVAMRSFEDWMLKECKDNPKMAYDFSLYMLGTYDDEKGFLSGNELKTPEIVMTGSEVMEKYEVE